MLDVVIIMDHSSTAQNAPHPAIEAMSYSCLLDKAESVLDGIVERLFDEGPDSPTCFHSGIRIFMVGYASNGNVGLLNPDCWSSRYYAQTRSEFNSIYTDFPPREGLDRFEPNLLSAYLSGNDPFGAVLWVIDHWDDLDDNGTSDPDDSDPSEPNLRKDAEKLLIVVTNDKPRNDEIDTTRKYMALNDTIINIIHGYHFLQFIPKYEEHNIMKFPYMLFVISPPPDFTGGDIEDDSDPFQGWPSMENDSTYVSFGNIFEENNSNNYYSFPMLKYISEDSLWCTNWDTTADSTEYNKFRGNLLTSLNHFLVTVHYRLDSTSSIGENEASSEKINISLVPNPFHNKVSFVVRYGSRAFTNPGPDIYDIKGRVVKTLLPACDHPGKSLYKWDGKDFTGAETPCGIYFYRLKISGNDLKGKILKLN